MIDVSSPFRAAPRITKAVWLDVVQIAYPTPLFAGIPVEDRPSVASGMYDFIARSGHDPAVWLAIGWCEHSLGTNPDSVLWRNDTRSWTNARTVRDPSLTGWEVITDAVRKSEYVRYQSVVDSLQDGLYRVDEPGYEYRKHNAVSIIDHTLIWTEGDGAQYAAKMVERINAWMKGEPPMPDWTPPPVIRRILPRDASNTPQRTMDWQYITVHNTGNPNPTADALMHAAWLESLAKSGADEPSWGYTVDDTRIVQHLEDDQAGWHASDGDGPGNMASLGFELCEIGDQDRVIHNAAWIIAQKLRGKSFGIDRVRQHHDWARDKKNCPRLLRANGGAGWKKLLALIQQELDGQAPPTPPAGDWPTVPPAVPDPHTDNPWGRFWIVKQFAVHMASDVFLSSGYVVSPAFAWTNPSGEVLIVQYCERRRYELHQSGEVTLGLVGLEAMYAAHPERKP